MAIAVACSGCGTLAPDGGGATDLPLSGAGPYRKLAPDGNTPIDEPVILNDAGGSLDDAFVLADGERLTVWVTRTTAAGKSDIRRADLPSLEEGATGLDLVLSADQPWEGNAVSQPTVLRGAPWLLFYAAAGAIGYATSDDGRSFTKVPGPALTATAAEGALSSPTAIVSDGKLRLLYRAGDRIYAADASLADLAARAREPLVRVPGALVAAGDAPWLPSLGRCTARTVTTATGRARHDLFLTGAVDGVRAVGLAASYDGAHFAVAAHPFLDPRPPEEWAPTVTAYRTGSLLVFTQSAGVHTVIAAATDR